VAKYLVLTLLLWLVLRLRRLKPALARGALLLAAYAVAVLPWMAFNYRNSGYFGISKGEGTNLKLRAAYIGLAGGEARPGPARRAAEKAPASEARPRDAEAKRPRGRWPEMVEARARRDDAKLSNTVRLILRRPWTFAGAAARDFFLIMAAPDSSVQFDDSATPPVPCCLVLKDFSTKVFPNRPAGRSLLLRRLLHFQLARLKPGWSFVFVFFLLGAASFLADRGRDRLTGLLLLSQVAYFALSAAVFMKPIDRFFLPALGFYLLFAAWGAVFLFRVLRRRLRFS
jgi:hypothetical protein